MFYHYFSVFHFVHFVSSELSCFITCLPTVTPPLMIPKNGKNGVNLSTVDFTSLLKSLSDFSSFSNSSLLSIASNPPKRSANLLIIASVRKQLAFSACLASYSAYILFIIFFDVLQIVLFLHLQIV